MGKKMKLPFLSHSKSLDPKPSPSSSSSSSSSPPWPFPSCGNIKTLSFRCTDDNALRTFNSAFLEAELTPPESFFTVSSSTRSLSTMSEDSGDPVGMIIHGLRSDRLFFEPEWSSSLLLREQEHKKELSVGFWKVHIQEKEKKKRIKSDILSIDSNNPCEDFRRSMEDMVEAHGLKDWQGLEELLGCYLKINGKNNHGYIVGAFSDLLVNFLLLILPHLLHHHQQQQLLQGQEQ